MIFISLFLTSVSKGERQLFYTTINELIRSGYTVLKITYEKDGVANHRLECSLHIGTHIDAPGHFTNNNKKICDFAVTKFIGQAKLIDVRGSREITIDHVKNQISLAKIVIFFTGFGNLFKTKNYFYD